MNRLQMIQRVRSLTRDLSNSIFREVDITEYLNESIDRVKQVIQELDGMSYLTHNTATPEYLPEKYHHLLPLYSTARCFSQDERHYQATNYMNEFESKLEELRTKIELGDVKIVSTSGEVVVSTYEEDYVKDTYFVSSPIDLDNGVEEE